MTRWIFCKKLGQKMPALESPPYPGELGKKIYAEISAEAWEAWLQHQTMLINEYRLTPMEKTARTFLEKEMQTFLFEGGSQKPTAYTPPSQTEDDIA